MTKLVTLSGSYGDASKTGALINAIAYRAVEKHHFSLFQYDMADLGVSLGLAKSVNDLELSAQKVIDQIANADALIIGTPVYKGSYPGLFKHFIDLLDPDILYGKPVLLAATGGGNRHALVVEHQLRPLLGFFMAHSLPTAIYASSQDYSESQALINPDILQRITQAVDEFTPFVAKRAVNQPEIVENDEFKSFDRRIFQTLGYSLKIQGVNS